LFRLAVIVAEVDDETPVVLTVNVAVVAPAATVTEAGTVALVLLDDRVTAAPPVPAALERVTVPVEEFPPETDVGLTATEVTVGPLIVSVAVLEAPPDRVPVIVTVVFRLTAVVFTVNVAAVWPAGTVTEAGSVAEGLLELNVTTVPPVGTMTAT